MLPVGLPLLLIPFALYNVLVLVTPEFAWDHEIWNVHMMSGSEWSITPAVAVVAGSVLILLVEMLRATRRTIMDHVLSMILFVAMLVEFMTVRGVASATFPAARDQLRGCGRRVCRQRRHRPA
jgi:hypothetical protein